MDIHVPPTEFGTELVQGGVKAAIKDAGATTAEQLMVPLENIKVVAGLNVRIQDADYEEHVETITVSIVENGFFRHMPLSGFAGKEGDSNFIYCTGGFTRLAAAIRAKERGAPIEKIPVVLQTTGTNMADITSRLDIDNKNRPLKPYERGIIFKRLISFGQTEEQIATRHGVSEQYVKELLYLMGLPQALRGLIIHSKVGALDAVRLAKKIGPTEALKAYESDLKNKGDTDPLSTETAPAAPSAVAQARQRGPVVAKKTLFRAIDYTLSLPVGEALKWLKRWRDADADAVAELEAYKPPRKNANPKATKRTGKKAVTGIGASGKPGRPKKNATAAPTNGKAPDDPFDISEGADTAADDVL